MKKIKTNIVLIVILTVSLCILLILNNKSKSNRFLIKNNTKIITNENKFNYFTFNRIKYDSVRKICTHNYEYDKLLLYSILASNKLKYGYASYTVFFTISNMDTLNKFKDIPNLDFLDDDTKKIAITYLIKASNEGQKNAKLVLGNYYLLGKYVTKNEQKGQKLINEGQIE